MKLMRVFESKILMLHGNFFLKSEKNGGLAIRNLNQMYSTRRYKTTRWTITFLPRLHGRFTSGANGATERAVLFISSFGGFRSLSLEKNWEKHTYVFGRHKCCNIEEFFIVSLKLSLLFVVVVVVVVVVVQIYVVLFLDNPVFAELLQPHWGLHLEKAPRYLLGHRWQFLPTSQNEAKVTSPYHNKKHQTNTWNTIRCLEIQQDLYGFWLPWTDSHKFPTIFEKVPQFFPRNLSSGNKLKTKRPLPTAFRRCSPWKSCFHPAWHHALGHPNKASPPRPKSKILNGTAVSAWWFD